MQLKGALLAGVALVCTAGPAGAMPTVPVQLAPFDNAEVTTNQPTFAVWSTDPAGGTTDYQIVLHPGGNGDSCLTAGSQISPTPTGQAGTVVTVPLTYALSAGTYFWCARATTHNGSFIGLPAVGPRYFVVPPSLGGRSSYFEQSLDSVDQVNNQGAVYTNIRWSTMRSALELDFDATHPVFADNFDGSSSLNASWWPFLSSANSPSVATYAGGGMPSSPNALSCSAGVVGAPSFAISELFPMGNRIWVQASLFAQGGTGPELMLAESCSAATLPTAVAAVGITGTGPMMTLPVSAQNGSGLQALATTYRSGTWETWAIEAETAAATYEVWDSTQSAANGAWVPVTTLAALPNKQGTLASTACVGLVFPLNTTAPATAAWFDSVQVLGPYATGVYLSAPISLLDPDVGADQWGTLAYKSDGIPGPAFRLQYWDGSAWTLIPDHVLADNSTGLANGQDLSSLGKLPDLPYASLRLEIDFADQPNTQRLYWWQISLLPATGACAGQFDGSPCTADACAIDPACSHGECVPQGERVCPESVGCMSSTCFPGGCQQALLTPGTPCDSGANCTGAPVTGTCNASGACTPSSGNDVSCPGPSHLVLDPGLVRPIPPYSVNDSAAIALAVVDSSGARTIGAIPACVQAIGSASGSPRLTWQSPGAGTTSSGFVCGMTDASGVAWLALTDALAEEVQVAVYQDPAAVPATTPDDSLVLKYTPAGADHIFAAGLVGASTACVPRSVWFEVLDQHGNRVTGNSLVSAPVVLSVSDAAGNASIIGSSLVMTGTWTPPANAVSGQFDATGMAHLELAPTVAVNLNWQAIDLYGTPLSAPTSGVVNVAAVPNAVQLDSVDSPIDASDSQVVIGGAPITLTVHLRDTCGQPYVDAARVQMRVSDGTLLEGVEGADPSTFTVSYAPYGGTCPQWVYIEAVVDGQTLGDGVSLAIACPPPAGALHRSGCSATSGGPWGVLICGLALVLAPRRQSHARRREVR